MAYTYSKIATYTVGSGGIASIDFTNIPSTYTDLVVKISPRSTGNYGTGFTEVDDVRLRFNSSSSAIYSSRRLAGSGSGTTSTAFPNEVYLERFYTVGSGSTANTFGNLEIYIPNYTSSNHKSISAESVGENNATAAWMNFLAGIWANTSAITSISFSLINGNFAQHTTAHLYGIKAEL